MLINTSRTVRVNSTAGGGMYAEFDFEKGSQMCEVKMRSVGDGLVQGRAARSVPDADMLRLRDTLIELYPLPEVKVEPEVTYKAGRNPHPAMCGQPWVIKTVLKEVEEKVADVRSMEEAERIAEALNAKEAA